MTLVPLVDSASHTMVFLNKHRHKACFHGDMDFGEFSQLSYDDLLNLSILEKIIMNCSGKHQPAFEQLDN